MYIKADGRRYIDMNNSMIQNSIELPEIVGSGYGRFWNWKGRYRVCKGSRASKKSRTSALWFIVNMMKYEGANLLVVRKVYRTLKDSCFSELKWAVARLGAQALWEIKESPLEMKYKPTGQKIFFRGLDDPFKINSITAENGYLCWVWIEEAYEIGSESDFNMLDESIRGAIPTESGLFKQLTLTLNPWNQKHWIKKRFFDGQDDSVLAMTTDYFCNEWLDEKDRLFFENMRVSDPRRYQVAGLGEWGVSEGLVFENWEERVFDTDKIRGSSSVRSVFGLDFGYTNDPTALFCGLADTANKTLWVFDELYKKGIGNEALAAEIIRSGYGKEKIIADSSEPKSIDRLRELGVIRIKGAAKGRGSINGGIDRIRDFHIIIHPKCVNFITEISNYVWANDKSTGKRINVPAAGFDHLMDAMRYGMEDICRCGVFSFD